MPHLRPLPAAPSTASHAGAVLRALRPHQWLKNLLILVPPLAAHRLDGEMATASVMAFAAFSLFASGGYVLNDLRDVAADRVHARKHRRPFAAGQLSTHTGVLLLTITWVAGFAIAVLFLPPSFTAVVGLYLVATAAYSIRLKREPALDVVVLASLYVLRIIAGGVATNIPVSTWLLAFTLFVSLSIAFLKRFIEVIANTESGVATVPGRGYHRDDATWLHSAGMSSAYLAVVVLAIYANNADTANLYSNPQRLLLICPLLLYAATRTWLRAHRRGMHDDPLVAIAQDPVTYVVAVLAAAVVVAAV